jgi:transcriptional regulator GlxA family with amidase domain
LLVIRIKKAEEMLRLGKYSIGEIAEKCGFVNAGHFSSLFKRHLGVSPSEYKKNINP